MTAALQNTRLLTEHWCSDFYTRWDTRRLRPCPSILAETHGSLPWKMTGFMRFGLMAPRSDILAEAAWTVRGAWPLMARTTCGSQISVRSNTATFSQEGSPSFWESILLRAGTSAIQYHRRPGTRCRQRAARS